MNVLAHSKAQRMEMIMIAHVLWILCLVGDTAAGGQEEAAGAIATIWILFIIFGPICCICLIGIAIGLFCRQRNDTIIHTTTSSVGEQMPTMYAQPPTYVQSQTCAQQSQIPSQTPIPFTAVVSLGD